MSEKPAVNMATLLREAASRVPHKRAAVFPLTRDGSGRIAYTQLSFSRLEDESNRYAHGLRSIGIKRGVKTVLMLKPSLEFFAITFALFKVGAIVVFIDPGIGMKNLKKCLEKAEPEAFIGITKAHAARVLFRWASKSIRICVTHGTRLFWGGFTLEDLRSDKTAIAEIEMFDPDEMSAIMFTSGSTGISKGVVYTHGILSKQAAFIQETYDFQPDDIDLATFPLFALFDICLGMTSIIPDMDATKPAKADPKKLTEAITDHAATVMFGSPALIDTFSRWGEKHKISLPTIKKVISCGAPARNDVLARFRKMLPEGTDIFTPYGATEALPVASIGSSDILGETAEETSKGGGTCVGYPNSHVEVKIIGITDDPIPEWSDSLVLPCGEIGEIVVKGPIVTREYYRNDPATVAAKIYITDPNTDRKDFYHRMGDVGRLDVKGRLWFCGRKSHRVTTEAETLFTIPCERVFNEHPKVFRTALIGIGPAGRQEPVLCVELEKRCLSDKNDSGSLNTIKSELLEIGARFRHTDSIKTILFHDDFPVDIRHNAKIGREELASWARERLAQIRGE